MHQPPEDHTLGLSHHREPDAPPPDRTAARRTCRRELWWIGLALFVYMMLTQVLSALVFQLLLYVAPGLLLRYWVTQLAGGLCMYVIGPLVMVLLLRRVRTGDLPGREHERMDPVLLITFCAIGYGCALAGNLLTQVITGLLAEHGNEVSDALGQSMQSADSVPALGLSLVLVAPVAEELIFRHILLRRLRKYGDGFCMFTTALAFSLFHANLPQMIYAFVLGLVLAYVVLRYGKLIHAIVIHAFINLLGFVSFVVLRYGRVFTMSLYSTFALFLALFGMVMLALGARHIRLQRSSLPLGTGTLLLHLLVNPGMILFFAEIAYLVWRVNFH